jgi:hypothetical protein
VEVAFVGGVELADLCIGIPIQNFKNRWVFIMGAGPHPSLTLSF